jgi:protein TonB
MGKLLLAAVAAMLWMLVGIMLGSFLERQADVARKIESANAQRVQSAAAIKVPSVDMPVQKKANDVGSGEKPPAPPKTMCFLGMTRNGVNVSSTTGNDAEILYYPDESANCLHRPHVEPSWQTALFRQLYQYKRYPSDTQSQGQVLLSFRVDRSGHVLNREIVTADHGRVVSEIERNSGHRERDNAATSMIDRAQPLPRFPDSMAQATLDLIAPISLPVKPTTPDDWGRRPGLPSLGLSLMCGSAAQWLPPQKKTLQQREVFAWVVVDTHNVFVSGGDTNGWQVFVLPVTRVSRDTVYFAYESGTDESEGFISHNVSGEYDASLDLSSNDRSRVQHWDNLQCKALPWGSEFADWLAETGVQERKSDPKRVDPYEFRPRAQSSPAFTIPFQTLPPSPQCPKIIGDGALMCGKLAEKYDLYCCN